MPAEDTVFYVLYDKFMFWSILVAIFTFGWLFTAILRYRDGVEPDTTDIDRIEVGAFPLERHNTRLEIMFYLLPTILVVWVTIMAIGSNSAVWNFDDDDTSKDLNRFDITINAYQWYFEFIYEETLTWEDTDTGIDVVWDTESNTMQVTSFGNSAASLIEVKLGSIESELFFNGTDIRALTNTGYSSAQHNHVKVFDADGALLHTWEHIPIGHKLITPSNPMIIPCDEVILANMHSKPVDASDTRNVGVQHAFWVPEWGMKEDFVPGLAAGTNLGFIPDDAGTFPIRCAEYCGMQHSIMTGEVKIVDRVETEDIPNSGLTCAQKDSGVQKTGSSSANNYDGGEM
jgi:heme/copper-type cytochrome/quinol oxidase subunit 2